MNREVLYVTDDVRLKQLEKKIEELTEIIGKLVLDKQSLGDWITEEHAMQLTGLGKSKLYDLRNSGKVRCSTMTDRKIFYKRKDFERLLIENQK